MDYLWYNFKSLDLYGFINDNIVTKFYFYFQWSSRNLKGRRKMYQIRPCALSISQGHYELYASNEIHVCQCGSHRRKFRPRCQAHETKLTWTDDPPSADVTSADFLSILQPKQLTPTNTITPWNRSFWLFLKRIGELS